MTTKHEKEGPELFLVDEAMLQGVETLAKQYKAAHDDHNYEFLTRVKTALSKYPVAAKHITEIAAMNRTISKSLSESADYTEQLFPKD